MRSNFDESMSLEELAQAYVENKRELDSYKKICDEENKQIKQVMEELGVDSVQVGNKSLKKIVTTSYKVNEPRMVEVLKKYNVPAVRTVEVVDEEALESFLYHAEPEENKELIAELNLCKTPSEVVQLRLVNTK